MTVEQPVGWVYGALEGSRSEPLAELSDPPASIARHRDERRCRRDTCLTTSVTISSRLASER
jgi:hypothetical protein